MTLDSLLFNAGTIFFAAWIVIIGAVSIVAFGRDLLPSARLGRRESSGRQT